MVLSFTCLLKISFQLGISLRLNIVSDQVDCHRFYFIFHLLTKNVVIVSFTVGMLPVVSQLLPFLTFFHM